MFEPTPTPTPVPWTGDHDSPREIRSKTSRGSEEIPRVVITGIGLRTSLGRDRETTWNAIKEGRSGACEVRFAADRGGESRTCAGFPLIDQEGAVNLSRSRPRSLAVDVAKEALIDAFGDRAEVNQFPNGYERHRVTTVIGGSKGRADFMDQVAELRAGSAQGWSLGIEDWLGLTPSRDASLVAQAWGFEGPLLCPVAACATGLVAVLRAAEMIRRGDCDCAVAGSVDASFHPLWLGAFQRMGVLAKWESMRDPRAALRPWSRTRSGFLVGEGGAIFVLEREDRARRRGAKAYTEVANGALGCDAHHLTDLNPDPIHLARLITQALDQGGIVAEEIDHINVHGTATSVNDPLECRAIRLALGREAERVTCTASKAQIGHLLGAAGSVELALTCLAMRDSFVPPTLNLTDPDPECDLECAPFVGKKREIHAALKLSLGFGGHLAVAVLRRPEAARQNP